MESAKKEERTSRSTKISVCLVVAYEQGRCPSERLRARFPCKGLIEALIPPIDVIPELKGAALVDPCREVKEMDIQGVRNKDFLLGTFLYGGHYVFSGPARVLLQQILCQFDRFFNAGTTVTQRTYIL